jgi:hypothetical protein
LSGKDNQQHLPHLWPPPHPESRSPGGTSSPRAPENDRLGGSTEKENIQPTEFRQQIFSATRIPLSGSSGGRFSGDITTPLLGHDLTVEVKARRRFAQHDWIDGADVLVLQGDHQEPLVVVRLRFALEVAVAAERCAPKGMRIAQDRAAVIAETIIQLIFSSPRNLRAQIEALLRHQFYEIQQETLNEIRREDK